MKKIKNVTAVTAAICPDCKDEIFSRTRHDFRSCSCGKTSIDGGFDYTKLIFEKTSPKLVKLMIPATKRELFDDWNNSTDNYGIIKYESKSKNTKN
jgi:hypothetical protein